jgi:hypothetical protein
MVKYKKTKAQRKIEKKNLINAYNKAIESGSMSESNGKKAIAEINKDYKEFGV